MDFSKVRANGKLSLRVVFELITYMQFRNKSGCLKFPLRIWIVLKLRLASFVWVLLTNAKEGEQRGSGGKKFCKVV